MVLLIQSMNVAFSLPGNIPIYAFPLLVGLGATFGLAWVAFQAPPKELRLRIDAGLWALLGALLGSRISFVLVNSAYYRENPWEALAIYQGGLSWPGAMAGGVLALLMAARLLRTPTGKLADAMLPLVASVAVSAWMACWQTGCAYGPPADHIWGIPAIDEWGHLAPRWPTQLIGAMLALVLVWILDCSRSWPTIPRWAKNHGNPAALGVLGLSLELLALSFLRADPAVAWRGLRLDAWAALAIVAFTTLFLIWSALRWVHNSEQWEKG